MKKTLFAIALALASIATMAQNNFTYRIDNWHSSDDLEVVNYFYDSQNNCVKIEDLDNAPGGIWSYDSICLDENGDMVRLDTYQWMNSTHSWQLVCYCEYTYDNEHHLLTRTNYNNFGGSFELGGVYHFEYDDQGRLATRWLNFANTRYDEMLYTYDAQGRLEQTLYKVCDYPSPTLLDYERCDYTYGSDGHLSLIVVNNASSSGSWSPVTRKNYSYTSDGNLHEYYATTPSGATVMERRVYEYCDLPLSQTQIHHDFEREKPLTYENTNLYHTMHLYMADQQDVLQYVCDYIYEYTDNNGNRVTGNPLSSIDQAQSLNLSLYPNPATTSITVEGLEGDRTLYLYSLDGRLSFMQRLAGHNATIDVSSLARGTYVVRIDGQQPRTTTVILK